MSSGEADAYRGYECKHYNTANHFDNPNQFHCLNCGISFVDYNGKGFKEKPRGLAGEEVPKPYETKGYWYTKYMSLLSDFDLLYSFCNRDIIAQYEGAKEDAKQESAPVWNDGGAI